MCVYKIFKIQNMKFSLTCKQLDITTYLLNILTIIYVLLMDLVNVSLNLAIISFSLNYEYSFIFYIKSVRFLLGRQ